jgi:hypothetical protein
MRRKRGGISRVPAITARMVDNWFGLSELSPVLRHIPAHLITHFKMVNVRTLSKLTISRINQFALI